MRPKISLKTQERRRSCFNPIIVNSGQIYQINLVFSGLILTTYCVRRNEMTFSLRKTPKHMLVKGVLCSKCPKFEKMRGHKT